MSRLYILQAEYCNADRTTWKLTLQDINTTPKELKTERDCSHRQLFRYNQLSSHVEFLDMQMYTRVSVHASPLFAHN